MKTMATKVRPDYIAPSLYSLVVPIGTVQLDPQNARRHDAKNRAAIRASLLQRGQTLPITVRKATGIAMTGNCTLEIARELGWTHIAAVVLDYSEEEAITWAIAHNRTGELSTWDEAQLASLIASVPEVNWIDIGFDAAELEQVMRSIPDLHVESTERPAENDPATQWVGMPEFDQKDKTAFRSITVHFHDEDAVKTFFDTLGKPVPPKLRYMWYPEIQIETYADKVYTQEESE